MDYQYNYQRYLASKKQIDDLQNVITQLKKQKLNIYLDFVNFKK